MSKGKRLLAGKLLGELLELAMADDRRGFLNVLMDLREVVDAPAGKTPDLLHPKVKRAVRRIVRGYRAAKQAETSAESSPTVLRLPGGRGGPPRGPGKAG